MGKWEEKRRGSIVATESFSTGEVARILDCAQQTVIRLIDRGLLAATRVGVGRFRRVARGDLINYMVARGIPLERLYEHDHSGIRVLIVDDDLAIIQVLAELLLRDGRFAVRHAGDAFDAGATAAQFKPDAILLDYCLPDANGDAVMQRVRSDRTLRHARIILMSGILDRHELEPLLAAGAETVLQKPFSAAGLIYLLTHPPDEGRVVNAG